MSGRFLLGVDGGTESVRAIVFDESGVPLGQMAAPYPTAFPAPAQAEQAPEDWWRALGQAVQGALARAGVAGDDIAALAVDTTCCSVVTLDRKGRALTPALIWMDVRAEAEAELAGRTGDPALAVNGAGRGPVSAEWMVPKALWIKTHQPRVFEQARWICEYQDYINYRLTGEMVASLNNAAVRWHHGAVGDGPPLGLLRKLGLEALADKWPQTVLPPGAPVGCLTAEAAAHLGLPRATLVAQGGADAFIGMIGLGVVAPGSLAFITGSSHLQLGLSASAIHGEGFWGSYRDALIPGLHVVEGGQTSTGSVVRWFRDLLGGAVDYATLDAEAAAIAPGSDGLIVQDHFQGNRTPYTDAASRGAVIGLTLNHTRGHIHRAILEGVAFGSALVLDTMRAGGVPVEDVVIAGGATRSPLWLQIHADITGLPLHLTQVSDAPALGAAILAGVAFGRFSSIAEGVRAMVTRAAVIEPDPHAQDAYRAPYAAYRNAYAALHRLRTVQDKTAQPHS